MTRISDDDAIRAALLTDFGYFVRFFFRAQYNKHFMLEPYHAKLFDALSRVAGGETTRLVINIPPRYAKAIDSDTPMWTPDGWVRAGDIRVGGDLLGSDGRWTTVLGVYPQGVKPADKVSFTDGSSLVACGEHRWSARLRDKAKDCTWTAPWQIKTTDELAVDLVEADGRNKWRIPVLVDGNDRDVDLPIDPYLFGLWLGDGHSHYGAITTMDQEIIDCFAEFDPKPHTHQSSGRATTYGLRKGFGRALIELGVLKNKHIPEVYLRASHCQRLALLQGMADTDGTINKKNGAQSISFSKKRLSDDLHFLINSLGGVWRCNESHPSGGKTSYKTTISLADGDVAFRLRRKLELARVRSERNSPRRFVSDISPVDAREMVCFTVDATDHLFCAGRYLVVTHNTEIAVKMFVAWCLANSPGAKFIHLSYSDDLALDNSSAIRDLVKSEKFQRYFPLALRSDSDSKKKWFSSAGGGMYATAAGGAITGFGAGGMGRIRTGTSSPADAFAGCIILDDPLKPDDAFSDTMRDRINRRFNNTIASRTNSPETPIIVIMQRLHENDMTGYLLGGGSGEIWEHLCLPAITESGEALWPEKHSIEILRQMEQADPYTFCTPGESPVLMRDLSMKAIRDVAVGDKIVGIDVDTSARWGGEYSRKRLVDSEVVAISKSVRHVVKITLDSGDVLRCTPDHKWYTAKTCSRPLYKPAAIGSALMRVCPARLPCVTGDDVRNAGWLSGFFDGEGSVTLAHGNGPGLGSKFIQARERVVSIEPDGEEVVYGLTTTTGNYVVWGIASSNSGQYMQRPSPLSGGILKPDNISIIDAIPAGPIEWVRGWDFASTTTGDWTAGAKMGKLPDGRIIIGDMVRVRVGPDERDAALVNATARDGVDCRVSIPQDPGQAGVTQVKYLIRQLVGYSVKATPESGNKVVRCEPFAAQVNVGNVMMLKADWNTALVSEMRMFPNGTWDDQVDACSRAFSELIGNNQADVFWPDSKAIPININQAAGMVCGSCTAFDSGLCRERGFSVGAADVGCPMFSGS